jgi:hypothetical protein
MSEPTDNPRPHREQSPPSEMVERVAKAIYENETWKSWEHEGRIDPWRDAYIVAAQAAIAAMREPTEAMLKVGEYGAIKPAFVWGIMIDAALGEDFVTITDAVFDKIGKKGSAS